MQQLVQVTIRLWSSASSRYMNGRDGGDAVRSRRFKWKPIRERLLKGNYNIHDEELICF